MNELEAELRRNPDVVEEVERATLRAVCEAMLNIAPTAFSEFEKPTSVGGLQESDRYSDLGEDLTRMALNELGYARIPNVRIFGAVDYKAPRYVFLADRTFKQALFVDSKAEKGASNNARIQITQTSMHVRQVVRSEDVDIPGKIETVWEYSGQPFLTTTIFVKYHYQENPSRLEHITIAALPNGILQDRYNPDYNNNIWNVGPDAPTLDEKFRTRLNFTKLKMKARWRVQEIKQNELSEWQFVD